MAGVKRYPVDIVGKDNEREWEEFKKNKPKQTLSESIMQLIKEYNRRLKK